MFGLVLGGGTRTTSLRRATAILGIAVAVVLSGGVVPTAGAAVGDCTPSPSWGTVDASLEAQVVQLVNAHRNAMGLGSLTVSTSLTASAEWKSLHMAAYSYLAHDDPAPPVGRTVAQRLDACGYPSGAAGWGENIAYYYPDAASVMAAWLGDAGHKANIENPSWKTIGVGVARSGSGPIYWTQDFGTTGASSPPSAPAPQADTQPPTVPGGLGLSASGPTLNVSWQPSSDDVGVAGYDIFLNGNRLGIVQTTTGSISGAACGTAYAVGVDAFDAAGNHSAVVSATTQTTPCASASPPQPVPQPVTPASGASSGASLPPGSSGNQSAAGQTGTQQAPAGQSGGGANRRSFSCRAVASHPATPPRRRPDRFPCEATVAQGSRRQIRSLPRPRRRCLSAGGQGHGGDAQRPFMR